MNTFNFNTLDKSHIANIQSFLLFDSAKSCYVISRFCIETTFWEFYMPGFLLMQQCLENFIKSLLKEMGVNWQTGFEGHKLIKLIKLGQKNNFFSEKILKRRDFMEFLTELEKGYNKQRYGEAGYSIKNMDKMVDLFDEIVNLFITEFAIIVKQPDNERLRALPVSSTIEKIFLRRQKVNFTIYNTLDL